MILIVTVSFPEDGMASPKGNRILDWQRGPSRKPESKPTGTQLIQEGWLSYHQANSQSRNYWLFRAHSSFTISRPTKALESLLTKSEFSY